jgi:hypothetical protein
MLPTEVVKAYIEEELPGARAWAERSELELSYDPERLALRLPLQGPGPEGPERYLLEGRFDDYRALPPIWQFLHPDSGEEIGAAAFPAAPAAPLGGSSILLSHGPRGGVICAHFSRWAFGEGAPHTDWQTANWQNIGDGKVLALTIGDMVVRIAIEVGCSPGRMAPLS